MKTLAAFIAFLLVTTVSAQNSLWNSKGAIVYANPNVIIRVKGSFLNDTSSVFTNQGNITIDTNYTNNALSQGSGIYRVGGDWINNETFICDTSLVVLNGGNQLITGDSVSKYYNLELQNTGVKTQTIDSWAIHQLRLNDRELATDSFYMYVSDPAANAITRSTGFVSSLGPGRLVRFTMAAFAYLFPTGSSLGTLRYRPVEITPAVGSPNWYAVRMANNDATPDGYDRAQADSFVCDLNPFFYHFISRVNGNSDADVAIFYDPATDGNWDGMAYWSALAPLRWNDMSPVLNDPGTPLLSNRKAVWSNWQPEPYILSKVRPPVPGITGDTLVCGGYQTIYSADPSNPLYTYSWNVTSGGDVVTDSTASDITIDWGSGGTLETVTLVQVAPNGCSSFPGTMIVGVHPEPIAAFTGNPNAVLGSIPVQFTDASINAAEWSWNFGDGSGSGEQNPQHIFNEDGSYFAELIVTTAEGCTDTAVQEILILDGINIPNVFSPDGDGSNDVFYISGSNFENFHAQIFNRWGFKVFEADAAQISWDGSTSTGAPVPEGTYFLELVIKLLDGNEVKYGGTVNVFY